MERGFCLYIEYVYFKVFLPTERRRRHRGKRTTTLQRSSATNPRSTVRLSGFCRQSVSKIPILHYPPRARKTLMAAASAALELHRQQRRRETGARRNDRWQSEMKRRWQRHRRIRRRWLFARWEDPFAIPVHQVPVRRDMSEDDF